MSDVFRVFVGWDSREIEAYQVACYSLKRLASIPLVVTALDRSLLQKEGLYWRPPDALASTEFTFTRYLVPYLAGYEGKALYFDCDFLWREDVAELLKCAPSAKSVSCVQHNYTPGQQLKMDGRPQTQYPRKNWSSLMLFDCGHADCRNLSLEKVNSASAKYLHRFEWTSDANLGSLPIEWNWLENWYDVGRGDPPPAAVHFTRGGPWFPDWQHVDYAEHWFQERALMKKSRNLDHENS